MFYISSNQLDFRFSYNRITKVVTSDLPKEDKPVVFLADTAALFFRFLFLLLLWFVLINMIYGIYASIKSGCSWEPRASVFIPTASLTYCDVVGIKDIIAVPVTLLLFVTPLGFFFNWISEQLYGRDPPITGFAIFLLTGLGIWLLVSAVFAATLRDSVTIFPLGIVAICMALSLFDVFRTMK
jgi:hypothetical protein